VRERRAVVGGAACGVVLPHPRAEESEDEDGEAEERPWSGESTAPPPREARRRARWVRFLAISLFPL
jgi:hypothetical protein